MNNAFEMDAVHASAVGISNALVAQLGLGQFISQFIDVRNGFIPQYPNKHTNEVEDLEVVSIVGRTNIGTLVLAVSIVRFPQGRKAIARGKQDAISVASIHTNVSWGENGPARNFRKFECSFANNGFLIQEE